MGKFPLADEALTRIRICRKCKARNSLSRVKCRRCGSEYLRPKHKELKVKK